MAAKGFAYPARINRWGVLLTNGKEHLEELPHITGDLTELERLSVEALAVVSRGDDLRSQLQANSARLKELVKEGDQLRRRVGASLRGKYGFTSERLIKFGFRPQAVNRRRKPSVEKPPPEQASGSAK